MSDEVPRIELVVDSDHPATIDLEVVTGGLTEQAVQALVDDAAADGSNWTLTRDTGLELHHAKTTLIPDAETTIGDGWGWPAFPDITGGFLHGDDGVLRHYSSGLPTAFEVGMTTVVGDDLYAAPRESITVEGFPSELTYCSGGPIVEVEPGLGLMLLHLEWQAYHPTDPFVWTIAAGKVTDVGGVRTITYLGEVITHEMSAAEALLAGKQLGQGSGAFVVHDGHVYVYHYDHDAAGQFWPGLSRCSLTATAAALAADEAPLFWKWAGEALADEWTTPGLGGAAHADSPIPGTVTQAGDFVTLPDGRVLWVGADGWPDVGGWSVAALVAADPITWPSYDTAELLLERDPDLERIYGDLWSGDPANPKTVTRPSVLFAFVESADLDGRWGDYTVEQLALWPVASPEPYELDPAIQPERVYVSTAPILDLAAFDGPGKVIQTIPGTITMPPLGTVVEAWEVVNGSDGEVVIEVASGDPTFNGGMLAAIELHPEEVAHIISHVDTPTWITWSSSTGTRVVPSVFQVRLYAPFPIEGSGGTVVDRALSFPFVAGVLNTGAAFLLHNQTDPDDDGVYVALPDPGDPDSGFTGGDFEYAPEHRQPFRPHGVGLFVAAGVNFANGAPLQGVIFTTDGVTWTIEPFAYVPANGADWDDNPPTSLVAALDRIAAHLGPIP